jgi:ABC-2 type transport system ATP-binding protein
MILSISNVSHAYVRQKVIDDVSFGVPSGQVTMLLGPNGAGKTTLFSLITRLLALQHGKIFIEGQSIEAAPAGEARKVGIVFQQPAIDLDLSVRQNLRYFGRLLGLVARERERRLDDELSRLGLADRAKEKVRVLNGGHRRRVEIARALMARPSLLLLDEPTVGLDVEARQGLIMEVRRLVAEEGRGILWATHLLDEIEMSDRLVVLHKGRVLAQGSVQDVLAEAGDTDLQTAFLKLVNAPGTTSAGREAAE